MTPIQTVDAHHHFWDPEAADYPWLSDDLAVIRRAFAPEDLEPELEAADIDATILVQTRSSLEETREFLQLAEATPFIRGVIGWVDLTTGTVAETIAALRSAPGGDRLVGIRHQVHDEPDPEWLLRDEVVDGIRAVGAADLVYDVLIRPRELPAALRLARRLPEVRFVIDHLAKPPISGGDGQAWRDGIAAFSKLDHVACKISGLVTEATWSSWTSSDLQPYVDRAIMAFGSTRLVFGSDWPVCLLAATYAQVVDVARTTLGSLTPSEQAAVFGANAVQIYRL
jgi:L-fucono-1,5-lactonase